MATLSDIQKQIAKLEKQAEAMIRAAAAEAARKARELIEQHKLTAEDVGLAPKAAKATKPTKVAKAGTKAARPAGVPKYRDPKTGRTWTGNGKAPGWITGAKHRDKFLISASEATPLAEPAPAAAPVEVLAVRKKVAGKVAIEKKSATPKAAARKSATPKAADAPAPAALVKKASPRKAAVKKAVAPASPVDAAPAVAAEATPAADAAA